MRMGTDPTTRNQRIETEDGLRGSRERQKQQGLGVQLRPHDWTIATGSALCPAVSSTYLPGR